MIGEIACEWAVITGPKQEPISLEEAKLHAVVSAADDNSLIDSYRVAGRQAAENYMSRGLFTQTWKLQLSAFADIMWLPMASPLQNDAGASPSTAPVVQYYDENGTLQTLATSYYTVDTISEPGRILRAPNQTWPAVQSDRINPITITYVCGWTAVAEIPELIKDGIRLYVAYRDADRIGAAEAEASRKAAEACWRAYGEVFWRPPECRY